MQRLINDLLEFSRMEAGQIKLKPEMISLHEAAQTVADNWRRWRRKAQLTLTMHPPDMLPVSRRIARASSK